MRRPGSLKAVPKTILLVMIHLASVGSIGARPPAPSTSSSIDDHLRAVVAEHQLPSLSLAAARSGEIVYVAALGLANVEEELAASPETRYPIGSVSKTITATAALRMAEQGALDLDAPVEDYCPAFPDEHPAITARQLLGHLGGIRHYDYSRFEEDFLNKRRYESIEEALSKFQDDPLVAAPGFKYHYSSWGYVLLGCAMEGAAGSSYGEIVRKNVLDPATMTATTTSLEEGLPVVAKGYSLSEDGTWRPTGPFDSSDRIPAGGFISTPSDLVRFGIALLERRILSAESREMMWTVQDTTGGEPTGAGLGWSLSKDSSEAFHGGTTVGATSLLYIRPRDQIVVAFSTNLSLWTEGRDELARAVADLLAKDEPRAGETAAGRDTRARTSKD